MAHPNPNPWSNWPPFQPRFGKDVKLDPNVNYPEFDPDDPHAGEGGCDPIMAAAHDTRVQMARETGWEEGGK